MTILDELTSVKKLIRVEEKDLRHPVFTGDGLGEDLDIIRVFLEKIRKRGIDPNSLVFAEANIIHPDLFDSISYDEDELPLIEPEPTQRDAVNIIQKILRTGEFPRKTDIIHLVQAYKEDFPGSRYLDFFSASSKEDITKYIDYFDSAVHIGFSTDKLEVIDGSILYKFKDPSKKQEAVAVVGGFLLEKLVVDIPKQGKCYTSANGKKRKLIDNFLYSQTDIPITTKDGGHMRLLGFMAPEDIQKNYTLDGSYSPELESLLKPNGGSGDVIVFRVVDGKDSEHKYAHEQIMRVE